MDVYSVYEDKKQICMYVMNNLMNKLNKDTRFKVVHQIKATSTISSQESINNVFKGQSTILKE